MTQVETYDIFKSVIKKYFGERMKTDDDLCTRIWCSLANIDWYYIRNLPECYMITYSFRAAGQLIADIREEGNYMDWYCSGPDGTLDHEFHTIMRKEGFIPDDFPTVCDEPGCFNAASCGWPSATGNYRITCHEHYEGKLKLK